jgi:alpha-D-ribose 1-methylphosphonate 5-triphosphate synthase subunit PhnG
MHPSGRQRWLAVLAKAPSGALFSAWEGLAVKPAYRFLRQPEVGLIMVQARVGGSGRRFNLGEMTMTRCVVALESGVVGYSFVAGRRLRHAEVAAVLDAMLQDPESGPAVQDLVVTPLEKGLRQTREQASARTASTKVDFFTMVRGED